MRVLSSDTSDVGDETQPSRFSANQSSLLSLNFPAQDSNLGPSTGFSLMLRPLDRLILTARLLHFSCYLFNDSDGISV